MCATEELTKEDLYKNMLNDMFTEINSTSGC